MGHVPSDYSKIDEYHVAGYTEDHLRKIAHVGAEHCGKACLHLIKSVFIFTAAFALTNARQRNALKVLIIFLLQKGTAN